MDNKKRAQRLVSVQCSSCAACCHAPMVPITTYDLKRLVKATGISAGRLVKFYANAELDCEADDLDWIKLSYGKRMMGLRTKKTMTRRSRRTDEVCMFLSRVQRCTIYDARPMACRTFPIETTLDEENNIVDMQFEEVVRSKDIDCRRMHGIGNFRKRIRLTAIQSQDEAEAYWNKLEQWNSCPSKGKRQEFLAFLGFKSL